MLRESESEEGGTSFTHWEIRGMEVKRDTFHVRAIKAIRFVQIQRMKTVRTYVFLEQSASDQFSEV